MATREPCCRVALAPALRNLDALTRVFAALSDPIRLRILALLQGGEICVCHIHGSLDVPQPTVSRHLAYLRRTGLVEARRDGRWMHYRLTEARDPVVGAVISSALHALSHAEASARDRERLARVVA
jgi:ArsR family transcriptional regulator